ncbi:MAG: phosphoribosylaminoimidazolesuccinocarboxamide synthase [Ignavibacteria bacterium]|nr:phosphoribosylaminoimidazolesuccinocarboxamide synthase [Ignavibacteria bacterium]
MNRSTPAVITQTSSGSLSPTRRGKVRDIYDLGESLLIVATDRLSAFDVVLPDGIPNKGKVLTQISTFWFQKLTHIVPNHILSVEVKDFPEPFRSMPEVFAGRSMLVRNTRPLTVECVVRGYLSGSGWKEYQKTQSVCGITLPAGLRESDRLPEPIFTPSTKAEQGLHDENISFEQMLVTVGEREGSALRSLSLSLYKEGAAYAATKGIIIADTKFEFGVDQEGAIIWIDEALTPDSSRFWPMDKYVPGGAQPSFDKQFVRDYLLSIQWNKKPPAPALPPEIIATTSKKYEEALTLLTGHGVE